MFDDQGGRPSLSFRHGQMSGGPVSSYFGELTFGLGQMRERLPREAFDDLLRSLDLGRKVGRETADAIAQVIKDWAVAKGATHFCHWFQPMTGLTAEKHDSFISIQHAQHSELKVMERLTGSQLVQSEPDASSFPSGGMRSTFEARGYTAWDPRSSLFIVEEGDSAKTLCIPSVFFGYHGEALDNKTPLLRSVEALSREACVFLKLLGDVDVKSVISTVGAEQEYFLIDKKTAALRLDLMTTGRTLIGAASARGQKLEDHYFGSIPGRVKVFMEDLERELYRLGVPVKTRHNEVAPSQFEMAPIFENASIAADHNTLMMETMKRVASRHGFLCLLHEKPFAGVNGSGKHCNWSMCNDKGENLLDPGRTPHQNLRFLAMVAVVIRAVHEHADMLAASIINHGNELRLGGHEAPPNIISIFLGSMLEGIFGSIIKGEAAMATQEEIIHLGISHLPEIARDNTDRNRTSPFAFTGNKFEFRAVGASANIAVPMAILNAAVADSFVRSAARLKELLAENGGRDAAVMAIIREILSQHGKVLFSGNNHAQSWREEAAKRGLPAVETSRDAFHVLKDQKATEFLVTMGTLTREEIKSRYHVNMERYVTTLAIELQTICEIVGQWVIPALERQLIQSFDVNNRIQSKELAKTFGRRIEEIEIIFDGILKAKEELQTGLSKLEGLETEEDKVNLLQDELIAMANRLRDWVDQAEFVVAEDLWVIPKYRELLFHPSLT